MRKTVKSENSIIYMFSFKFLL